MPVNSDTDKQIAVMATDIKYIKKSLDDIKMVLSELDDRYVTKVEFNPVKLAVYGLIAVILSSVLSGIMLIILK